MRSRRWRLAALPLASVAAALLVAGPVSAGSCPADSGGPVDKASYALNERIEFFGNYTDFADPGTVTIAFSRPADGATQTLTAFNLPDGARMRTVTFTSRADIGTWDVTVTLVETAQSVTCTDRVTITGGGAGRTPAPGVTLPPTDTDAPASGRDRPLETAPVLVALGAMLLAVAGALEAQARKVRQTPPGA